MKALLQKKVPPIVGLDIGTRFIKAVLLEKSNDQFVVTAFACEAINGSAFADRQVKEFDAVSTALKKVKHALKKGKKYNDVAIAVAGSSVLSKTVQMDPDQTDYQLESQIEIEADSLIPYPLEEVYLDFEELGPSKTHVNKVNVLLSAAHKDIVDSRVTLLREIPFEPKVVDIEGYAMANAVNTVYAEDQSAIFFINIGASLLQVSAIQNGQVQYSKEHVFGTDALIQDISMMHGMEREDAQNQLIAGSLPEAWRSDTLPIFLSNLQQQINRAIQMYISTTHAPRPEKLLISGGGAVIQGLDEMLSQDLGVPVEVFNPLNSMSVDKSLDSDQFSAVAPLMTIALGLATRSFNPWHI